MKYRNNRGLPRLLTVAAVLLMISSMPLLLSSMVKGAVAADIHEAEEPAETYEVILILGCGIRANGKPSDMLQDRLETGIALYRSGVAPKLLLSGDHEHNDYNEVKVMKNYCLEAGIPEEAILCDRYGLSTYDSVVRAKNVFDVRRVVIVTQKYHLYRSLYIAEKIGVDAVGVSADLRTYQMQTYRDLREVLARCKDFYMLLREEPAKYPTEQ